MKELSCSEKNRILKDLILDDYYRLKDSFVLNVYITGIRRGLITLGYDTTWLVDESIKIDLFFTEKFIYKDSSSNRKLSLIEAEKILDEKYPS